jgi:hypothetical protein
MAKQNKNIYMRMNIAEDYTKEKRTIDIVWANIFGIIILLPILVLFGLPYYLIWQPDISLSGLFNNFVEAGAIFVKVFVLLLLGILLHELIHGITWAFYAKRGFRSIRFGVLWKLLTPYCHCKEPLKVKQYIIGAITPALFLGILPAVCGIVVGSTGCLFFGMFFTMAAAGDFLVVNLIWKEPKDAYVEDHPSEAGFFVYRKKEAK